MRAPVRCHWAIRRRHHGLGGQARDQSAAWDPRRGTAPGRASASGPPGAGPARTRQAEQRGAAMSPATAAEYILMLTAPEPPPLGQATPGNLSARERELVTLVAQGCTDAEIAAQLYISI